MIHSIPLHGIKHWRVILWPGVILGSTLTDKESFRSDLEENKAMEVKGRTKASRFPLHLEMFSPFSLY